MASNTRIIQEVTAVVDSMGFWDSQEKIYKINSDTKECLIELMRFLRKDKSDYPVLRHLGELNILEKDLLPLINNYFAEDEELANNVIRLLVMLTYPALVFFKEKMPDNVDAKRVYLQINGYLRIYKVVFSQHPEVWQIFCKKAQSIAAKEPIDQSEEEKILLERILILIRNILNVPKDTYLDAADEDELITEDLIVALNESGTLNLIIEFSSSSVSQAFCFHLLEIIYYLLRGQSPEFLAFNQSRSQHIAKKLKTELEQLKDQEKRVKNSAKLTSRFNRFRDSTYVVKNMQSLSGNHLIYHKTTEDPNKISLDKDKASTKKAKNRAPMQDYSSIQSNSSGPVYQHPSTRVHKILKEFCQNFIAKCYESLMGYVKNALENQNGQENDETYYFFAAYFFMEFNRFAEGDATFIEETFNFEYFHCLHTKLETYLDKIATSKADRESVKAWSRRCHTALQAYKELLFTITSVKSFKDDRMLQLNREMREKVLSEVDYRELLLNLICGYEEKKMSSRFLQDLIETNHVFLKMMERYTNNADSFVIKYCCSKVIKVFALAFKRFEANSETLNHAIIRMFHRIACDCKSPAFFFQLSIFKIFQRCFELSKIESSEMLLELKSFARFIIREFTKLAAGNDKLLVEILFWKTRREMNEIEENYVKPEEKPPKKRKEKGQKEKKRRKKKDGFINDSDRSEESNNEQEDGNLSDISGEGFIPQLSSTQKTRAASQSPPAEVNQEIDDDFKEVDYDEFPSEPESIKEFEDDDFLDIDKDLGNVTDGDKNSLPVPENDFNSQSVDSLISNTPDNEPVDKPVDESVDGPIEVTIVGPGDEPVDEPVDVPIEVSIDGPDDFRNEISDAESVEDDAEFITTKRKAQIILDDSDDEYLIRCIECEFISLNKKIYLNDILTKWFILVFQSKPFIKMRPSPST